MSKEKEKSYSAKLWCRLNYQNKEENKIAALNGKAIDIRLWKKRNPNVVYTRYPLSKEMNKKRIESALRINTEATKNLKERYLITKLLRRANTKNITLRKEDITQELLNLEKQSILCHREKKNLNNQLVVR